MIGDIFGEWTVIEEFEKPNQVNNLTALAEEMVQDLLYQANNDTNATISEVIELCIRTAYDELK